MWPFFKAILSKIFQFFRIFKDRRTRNISSRFDMEPLANIGPNHATPFFSVILTTYNRAGLITRALKSLIAQTEQDWEALIVDDGSTDDTGEKVKPFIAANSRIRYFKQANQGSAVARNLGRHYATGKYITFLDSDDEYEPEHLKSRKDWLSVHPEIAFLHGGVKIIGNAYVPDRFDYTRQIHLSECVIGGAFFIRRDVFSIIKEFRTLPIGTDSDFFERAEKAGIVIAKTDTPTYVYHRELDDSITQNMSRKNKHGG